MPAGRTALNSAEFRILSNNGSRSTDGETQRPCSEAAQSKRTAAFFFPTNACIAAPKYQASVNGITRKSASDSLAVWTHLEVDESGQQSLSSSKFLPPGIIFSFGSASFTFPSRTST